MEQNRIEFKQKVKREEGQSQISKTDFLLEQKLRSSCSVGMEKVLMLGVVTSRGEGVHSRGVNSGFRSHQIG